jgi:hypothetical protein
MYAFSVSWLGVILAVIVSMALGMVWYSPFGFGKQWMALVNSIPGSSTNMDKSPRNAYILSTILTFITAYIIAMLLKNLVPLSFTVSLRVGFLMWLGFSAPAMAAEYVFKVQERPWKLYAINAGYQLVSILLQVAVIYLVK